MAICVPEYPEFKTVSEQQVWRALRDGLPADAWILANFAFSDSRRDYEVDLLVVIPEMGVTIVEVKGGQLAQDEHGWWFQYVDGQEPRAVNPARQARDALYAIRDFLSERELFVKGMFHWMVAFPHTMLPDGFDSLQLPRTRIMDASEMPIFADVLMRRTMHAVETKPSILDCGDMVNLLVYARDPQKSWREDREHRDSLIRRWTEEQFSILDQLRRNPRFLVTGPAGSGKTLVALEQARRLSEAGNDVALVCYSVGLSRQMREVVATWSEQEQPKYVGTYSALAHRWGVEIPKGASKTWWREELPRLGAELAQQLPDDSRFDVIIIDEAQDLTSAWWQALDAAYRPSSVRGMFAFGDFDQSIFGESPLANLGLPTFTLSENLRNTGPIAELAQMLATDSFKHRAIEGPTVHFIRCRPESAVHAADEEVMKLIDNPWKRSDIALLTTNHRHPVHKEYEDQGRQVYWDEFWADDEIFYSHVTSFKGLERSVIVVAIDGWKEPATKREYLYTAVSRARELLIICGSESDLEAAGGAEILNLVEFKGEYAEEQDDGPTADEIEQRDSL